MEDIQKNGTVTVNTESESTPVTATEPEKAERTFTRDEFNKAIAAEKKKVADEVSRKTKEEIAKTQGYENWQAYLEAQTNSKISDKGLDPDSVRPVIKELIHSDPDYQAAMKYKEEKEALEKEIFAKDSIKSLNDKFGTSYNSINDLDPDTISMWNSGISLEKAYAANNWSKLQEIATTKAKAQFNSGKEHLTSVNSAKTEKQVKELSSTDMSVFKAITGKTEEQIKEFINRTK